MIPRAGGWARWRAGDSGQVTVFVVIIATACVFAAGLVYDGGRALAVKVEAVSHAQSAARAGAQELDLATYRAHGIVQLDPDAAVAAARGYLAAVGARGTVSATRETVHVTVTDHSRPQLLGFVGPIEVTGTGSAHPESTGTTRGGTP